MDIPRRILERRKAVRIPEMLPFRIGHEGYEIEATTLNISAAGALCRVDREIALMTQLDIALSLPSGSSGRSRTFRARGVVVRREKDTVPDKYLIAIYFSDVKPSDLSLLQEYIARRSSG
ncbi:MAG: hypothetical protein MOGMAGMI_00917 [Candidatus Omnitrophica bacterium]|nr:hypothetical protein [Candidatus Omnitrophota bacterium]